MKKNIIKSLIFTLCIFIFGIGTAFAVKTINSTYSLGNIASFMDVQYYEVDFDTNGGSGVFSKQRIKSGLKALEPNKKPTRSGYTFLYWSTSPNGAKYDFNKTVSSSFTLYAVWKENIKKYTVTFNLNGGNGSINSQTVVEGSTISRPSNPTRNGYSFKYWSTSSSGSEYNFSNKVSKNMTLYAIWEKEQVVTPTPAPDPTPTPNPTPPPVPSITYYTVTFNLNGGNGNISSQSIAKGGKVSKPTDPTKDNAVFDGWSTTKECSSEYDFNKSVTDNMTLYACFRDNYKITFNMQGLPFITNYTRTLAKGSNFQEYNQNKKINIIDTTTYSMLDKSNCPSVIKKLYPNLKSNELNNRCDNIEKLLKCSNKDNCYAGKYVIAQDADNEDIIYLKSKNIINFESETYNYLGLYKDKACTNKYSFSTSVEKNMTVYECYSMVGNKVPSDDEKDDNGKKQKNTGLSITLIMIVLAVLSVIGFVLFLITKGRIANKVD